MYYVTNRSAQHDRPDWDTIEPMSIANDETYDGDLLGLPLASFTTTLFYRHTGRHTLPTKSPYPRNIHGKDHSGRHHHRVKIKFYKHHYHIFLMATYETKGSRGAIQIQLLCIKKHGRDQIEDEVYGILLQHYRERELTEQTLDTYFPCGDANVYRGDSDIEVHKMFVNVHFTYPIDVRTGAHWDIVQKSNLIGTGKIDETFTCIRPDDLRSLWCIKHYFMALKDKVVNLDNIPKIRQILAPPQLQLKSLFHQRDDELIDKLAKMII